MSGAIRVQGATGPSVRAVSMRVVMPFIGLWLAELELDPSILAAAPSSGPVTITVGEPTPLFTMAGTIDARGSGAFLGVPKLRVLAGAAGWDQHVSAQDFQSDGGVTSSLVYPATGSVVGEKVNVIVPRFLGTHYVRVAGPASSIFEREGETWWVDMAGITQVGPRAPLVGDPSLTLIMWDPGAQVAEFTCDVLLQPGTVVVDPRIPTAITVRDVEQRFDASGSNVTAWCGSTNVAQLINDLRSMVEQFSGRAYQRSYLYRIMLQNAVDGRLQLQAVDPPKGMPDAIPIAAWGQSGDSAKYKLGSMVRVTFLEGDPGRPVADAFEPGVLPLERTVDAVTATHVGPNSALVDIAGGASPLVPAPWATNLATALGVFATALVSATTVAQIATAAGSLGTALLALPPSATVKTKAT